MHLALCPPTCVLESFGSRGKDLQLFVTSCDPIFWGHGSSLRHARQQLRFQSHQLAPHFLWLNPLVCPPELGLVSSSLLFDRTHRVSKTDSLHLRALLHRHARRGRVQCWLSSLTAVLCPTRDNPCQETLLTGPTWPSTPNAKGL